MPTFSATSRARLETCHPQLQKLFELVVRDFDCSVLVGFRGMAEQEEAFRLGHSTKHWPDSKHNQEPSLAADVAPYPIRWPTNDREWFRWYYFAGHVMGMAEQLAIPLRSGLDWDCDSFVLDQNLMDGPHFELMGM